MHLAHKRAPATCRRSASVGGGSWEAKIFAPGYVPLAPRRYHFVTNLAHFVPFLAEGMKRKALSVRIYVCRGKRRENGNAQKGGSPERSGLTADTARERRIEPNPHLPEPAALRP